MRLAFMSSVCPKMTLDELLAAGRKYGYQGIEFRPEWKHGHGVELTATTKQRKNARKRLVDGSFEGCCLAPGVKFCSEVKSERDKNLKTLLQYIDLAEEVGVGRIRVFGDPLPNAGFGRRAANYAVQAEYLTKGATRAAAAGVTLVLETHMNFRAVDAGEVLFRAAYPAGLRINWHLAHCLNHGEDVDEAYRHVKGLVAHAHFSVTDHASETLAMATRQAQLLKGEDFTGFFSVEVINPPDSEAVLKSHAAAFGKILKSVR
jgi:sugar phosphate isomerase/epimerase